MAEITESRARIDPTKGVLMLIYRVDDAAFNRPKSLSQGSKRQAAAAAVRGAVPFDVAIVLSHLHLGVAVLLAAVCGARSPCWQAFPGWSG